MTLEKFEKYEFKILNISTLKYFLFDSEDETTIIRIWICSNSNHFFLDPSPTP